MAFARDSDTATSSQTDFSISFPFISRTHVFVYVDGVEKTVTTDYTFVSDTLIRFNSGLTGGETVVRLRKTSQSTRLVDYEDPSALTEDDMDTDSLQAFYLVQEAIDAVNNALGIDVNDQFDAVGKKIIEVAEPVNDDDAASKEYVDDQVAAIAAAAGNVPAAAEAEDGNILSPIEGTPTWAEIGEAHIPDGLIDAGMIAATTITEAELANESVTGLKLEDASVNEEHFAEEAVATADIADAAVTLAKFDATAGTEGQVLTNEEATTVVWATPTGGSAGAVGAGPVVAGPGAAMDNIGTSYVDVTDLQISIGANETWVFQWLNASINGASGVQMRLGFNGPASPTELAFNYAGAASVAGDDVVTAYDTDIVQRNGSGTATFALWAYVENGANAGTFTARARSANVGTGDVRAGGILLGWRIA